MWQRARKVYIALSIGAFCLLAAHAVPEAAAAEERATPRARLLESEMLERGGREVAVISDPRIRVIRDVPYGEHKRQRFDVYLPRNTARNAPVIFMVHGGAWRFGNKNLARVIENKVMHWVPKGFVFVSTNYRLDVNPVEQARDVGRAVAAAQQKAASWHASPDKFVLMGHSAGAHLVTLLSTDPSLSAGIVNEPWLGTIALDSGAFDVVETMESPHLRLFDRAFGRDTDLWRAASPFHTLQTKTTPILAVCSTRRADACPQAHKFAAKATSLHSTARVLEKNFSHREINERLGEEPTYTAEVEAFMSELDRGIAALLAR